METSGFVRGLDELFHDEAFLATLSPSFRRYFNEFLTDRVSADVYVHKAVKTLAVTRGKGKRILDVGCGFGILSILLRLLGAREVFGVDYSPEKIAAAGKIAARMGVDRTEFLRCGAQELPFASSSFDVVICTAALSHIADRHAAISEFVRIVNPGGTVFIFEDNNALFFRYERSMRAVWRAAETGERLPGSEDVHMPPRPYRLLREEIIRKSFPTLSPNDVAYCVAKTAGMYGASIDRAVEEFRRTGAIVNREPFWCRNPATGEYMEFPISPMRLGRDFERLGTAIRFHNPLTPPYRGIKGCIKAALGRCYDLWPALMWRTSPIFIMTAVKRVPVAQAMTPAGKRSVATKRNDA